MFYENDVRFLEQFKSREEFILHEKLWKDATKVPLDTSFFI